MSESWVEVYGKFKTWEEKDSGVSEEKGNRSSDMPGMRVEEFLTFSQLGIK